MADPCERRYQVFVSSTFRDLQDERRTPRLSELLAENGFSIQSFEHSLNARAPGSDLRIQFTTDVLYQDFPSRAQRQTVLGAEVRRLSPGRNEGQ